MSLQAVSFVPAGTTRYHVQAAISLGHDTDTTACVAGGLAGIRYGVRGIPADWLGGLRGRDLATPLIEMLIARSE